jgi:hypothetical protein
VTTPDPETLVTVAELASYLDSDVAEATGRAAIRSAAGWLQSVTHFTEWPNPVPDPLWTWAVELAAIAHTNPAGLVAQTVGGESLTWPVARRRQEILTAAAAYYPRGGTPMWSFPEAETWPEC